MAANTAEQSENATTRAAASVTAAASRVVVRDAHDADVAQIAALHLAAFPEYATSRLGPEFMTVYYRAFLQHPTSLCRVACSADGALAGFVVGSTEPRRHLQRFYGRHLGLLLRTGARRLVREPAFVVPLLRRLPRLLDALSGRLRRPASLPRATRTLALMFIAVAERGRGSGVGGRLLADFEAQARARQCDALEVRADVGNKSGRRFYERFGFTEESAGGVVRLRKRLGTHD